MSPAVPNLKKLGMDNVIFPSLKPTKLSLAPRLESLSIVNCEQLILRAGPGLALLTELRASLDRCHRCEPYLLSCVPALRKLTLDSVADGSLHPDLSACTNLVDIRFIP